MVNCWVFPGPEVDSATLVFFNSPTVFLMRYFFLNSPQFIHWPAVILRRRKQGWQTKYWAKIICWLGGKLNNWPVVGRTIVGAFNGFPLGAKPQCWLWARVFFWGGGGVPVVGLAPTLKKASTAAAARFWIPLCVQCTARSMSFCSFDFSFFLPRLPGWLS